MGYKGRMMAVGIVGLFNILRYFYYHMYIGLPFEASFFILTIVFLTIAWWGGKQYDLAKYYSEKDPLTDTLNRRTIEQSFQKLAAKCQKEHTMLGIVMIDLDKFKEINDQFGHQKGDRLLKLVSKMLKRIAKEGDIIARWGGDEFIVIAPNVKESFEKNYKNKLKDELKNANTSMYPVEVSIGTAIYPLDGETFTDLIQQADEAMYKMKRHVLAQSEEKLGL